MRSLYPLSPVFLSYRCFPPALRPMPVITTPTATGSPIIPITPIIRMRRFPGGTRHSCRIPVMTMIILPPPQPPLQRTTTTVAVIMMTMATIWARQRLTAQAFRRICSRRVACAACGLRIARLTINPALNPATAYQVARTCRSLRYLWRLMIPVNFPLSRSSRERQERGTIRKL